MMIPRHDPHWLPRPRNRRGELATTAFALLMAAALASPAAAVRPPSSHDWERDARATGSLVDVSVLVDGARVPLYSSADFGGRRYFEASRGHNYALAIRNRTPRRIAVLVAVDGLNVVNGERSRLAGSEPMYVLDPYTTTTIRGWRTSLKKVRQFIFVDEERSYATRTDQANGDMGWIRILAFEEVRRVAVCPPPIDPPTPDLLRAEERAAGRKHAERQLAEREPTELSPRKGVNVAEGQEVARGTPAIPSLQDNSSRPKPSGQQLDKSSEAYPGTGWGAERRDAVREVEFAPAANCSDHIVLRYEYANGLVALGILPEINRLRERDRGELSFARPPRY